MSHSEWVLAISTQHRAEIEPQLDPAMKRALEAEAARSLAEQAELERAPQPPFDQFLAEYIAR
jgi:glutamate--cysteine ligase